MSLRMKLIAPVSALVTVLAVIFCAFLIYQQYSVGRASLEENASTIAQLQASAIAPSVWGMDNREVESILRGLAAYPGFVSGEVTDAGGKRLARIDANAAAGSTLSQSVDIVHVEGGKSQTIGRLSMTVSTAALDRAVHQQVSIGLIAFVLLIGLTGAGLWVAVSHVTNPLAQLAGGMRALAHGDRSVNIGLVDRTDEIGAMAQAVDVFRRAAARWPPKQRRQPRERIQSQSPPNRQRAISPWWQAQWRNYPRRARRSRAASPNRPESPTKR